MKPPLVSAILPFSNEVRLNLVRKAVNNFIRQNYTPYELVVVNLTVSIGVDSLEQLLDLFLA